MVYNCTRYYSVTKINLRNVYGPNDDSPTFFENLLLNVSALEGPYIIGGDFNCTLNPILDRSSQKDASHGKTRKLLNNYIHDLRLIDIWRTLNPSKRQYSYFSSIQKTQSHLDYFLISMELQPNIMDCWYNSIVLSDHAPTSIKLQLGTQETHVKRWRLQTYLLKDTTFVEFVEKRIDEYFEFNKEETSASIRWEAFKAYIRGEIIGYTSTQNKKTNQEIITLDTQIKTLETEIHGHNNLKKIQELLDMRAKYNQLTTDKIAKNLMWTKQAFYDQGKRQVNY